jgi:hypothetical protein
MKTTTLNKIRSCHPSFNSWSKLLDSLDKKQADDKVLTFEEIYKSNGLYDTIWCLRTLDGADVSVSVAVACKASEIAQRFAATSSGHPRAAAAHASYVDAAYAAQASRAARYADAARAADAVDAAVDAAYDVAYDVAYADAAAAAAYANTARVDAAAARATYATYVAHAAVEEEITEFLLNEVQ